MFCIAEDTNGYLQPLQLVYLHGLQATSHDYFRTPPVRFNLTPRHILRPPNTRAIFFGPFGAI